MSNGGGRREGEGHCKAVGWKGRGSVRQLDERGGAVSGSWMKGEGQCVAVG